MRSSRLFGHVGGRLRSSRATPDRAVLPGFARAALRKASPLLAVVSICSIYMAILSNMGLGYGIAGGVVDQPVEDGVGEGGITDRLMPLANG